MKLEIKSSQNPKFKLLKSLNTKKGRLRENLFIAEGKKFLNFPAKMRFSLLSLDQEYILSEKLFNDISTLDNSEGIISVIEINRYSLEDLGDKIVILDDVQNPSNLGAIIRNMDAFGFDSLVLTKRCADPFSPKAVRASMGSIMNIKVIEIEDEDIEPLSNKYRLYATDCHGDNMNDLEVKDKIGIIFGNESRGVSKKFLDISTKVTIPVKSESLNVAVASGIVLYLLQN